jgi:hypothetical protein
MKEREMSCRQSQVKQSERTQAWMDSPRREKKIARRRANRKTSSPSTATMTQGVIVEPTTTQVGMFGGANQRQHIPSLGQRIRSLFGRENS